MIPSVPFDIPDITVCGVTYSIGATFATQADLLDLLNNTFAPAFGLIGVFSIVSDQLIYTTSDLCSGSNCITVEDPNARITTDGSFRSITTGETRIT